jgi:uncharacterized protein (DUF305 family)
MEQMQHGHYGRFAIMAALMFIAMYGLMYAMVDAFANVFHNINQIYMAGLMTAAMVIIELGLMWSMYQKKNWNVTILGVSLLAFGACWFGIRQQLGVGDKQFLRSMIPHHAGAILMCEQAKVQDPEIRRLCGEIVTSQEREIRQMKALLARGR